MNRRRRRCFAGRSGTEAADRTRSAARLWTTSCGFEASETLPFPGADSIFSSPCGAISGQARDRSGECGGRGCPAARFFPRFLSFQCFARRKISPLVHRRRIRQSPTKLVGAALLRAEAGRRTGLAGTLGHGGFLVWRRAFEQHTTILLLRKEKFENLEGSHLAKTRSYREGGGISIQEADIAFAYI